MFERVYLGSAVRAEHERIANVLRTLFEHYVTHPGLLPPLAGAAAEGAGAEGDALARQVTDYLAGMTDRYCIAAYTNLQVPRAFAG
jgi:dGTPase